MNNHIILPFNDIDKINRLPIYSDWLSEWRYNLEGNINNGDIAISDCFQGIITDIFLNGEVKTDWSGIIEEYLTDAIPLAYSEQYGKRLFKFDGQWKQTPIYAIYTHWWINKSSGVKDDKLNYYSDLIEQLIQNNGWIYNQDVSITQIRTRMKSELLMSLAMGIEVLSNSQMLEKYSDLFLATVSSYPFTGYVSAEYFRLIALEKIGKANIMSKETEDLMEYCQAGDGFCDFSVTSKIDDYMGTLKRANRDKAIHSPLISLYAKYVSNNISAKSKEIVNSKLLSFGHYLNEKPMDIPAFRMRDIDIPFGTDITPLEIISANYLIDLFN